MNYKNGYIINIFFLPNGILSLSPFDKAGLCLKFLKNSKINKFNSKILLLLFNIIKTK
jgi:hypothetical protein